MSDAFTDIGRDDRRAYRIDNYLGVLLKYLRKKASFDDVKVAAKETDKIRGGFYSSETSFSGEKQMTMVENLQKGDAPSWLEFLGTITNERLYSEFKALSPFKGKLLLISSRPHASPSLKGPDVNKLLRMASSDNDDVFYQDGFLVIEESFLNNIEFIKKDSAS